MRMKPWFRPQLLGLLVAVALPLALTDGYMRNIAVLFCINASFAAGLNLLIGYVGQISFGHAAFLGIGAYASGLLATNLGLPLWVTLPCAVLIAGAVGALVALVSLRLGGVYLAIVTLAFAEIMRLVVLNWTSFTRGPMGLHVPKPHMPGDFDLAYYYMVLLILGGTIWLTSRLLQAPVGRAFLAVRDAENLAESVGINTFGVKVLGFALSTGIAGAAGAAYAHYYGVITPELLGVGYTATGLLMVIVGGKSRLYGPLLGALIFTVLPETLRMAGSLRMIVFGLLLLLTILFLPQGLARGWELLVAALRPGRHGERGAADGAAGS